MFERSKRLWRIVFAVCVGAVLWIPAAGDAVAQEGTAGARFEVAEGTRAYYRVREQLVGVSFLNDAVGVSEGVEGVLAVRADGTVDSGSSLTLDLTTFTSDQDRRDRFVRNRVFEVEEHPTAVFTPTPGPPPM